MAEDVVIKQVRRRVAAALEPWGTYFKERAPGCFTAVQGSAEVLVSVTADAAGTVLVHVRAPVAYGAQLTEADLRFLLELNDAMPIATFAASADGRVSVAQSLHGEWLQPDELRQTVREVALAADGLDELIAGRTGGQRSVDARPWLR